MPQTVTFEHCTVGSGAAVLSGNNCSINGQIQANSLKTCVHPRYLHHTKEKYIKKQKILPGNLPGAVSYDVHAFYLVGPFGIDPHVAIVIFLNYTSTSP